VEASTFCHGRVVENRSVRGLDWRYTIGAGAVLAVVIVLEAVSAE
jgi:hypothetical protein